MKSFKNNIAVFALVLGSIAAFAFKAPVKNTLDSSYWQYNGGTVTDPSSYTLLPGSPSCSGNVNICAIEAPADPNDTDQPLIDTDLQTRISNKDTSDGDVFLKRP